MPDAVRAPFPHRFQCGKHRLLIHHLTETLRGFFLRDLWAQHQIRHSLAFGPRHTGGDIHIRVGDDHRFRVEIAIHAFKRAFSDVIATRKGQQIRQITVRHRGTTGFTTPKM